MLCMSSATTLGCNIMNIVKIHALQDYMRLVSEVVDFLTFAEAEAGPSEVVEAEEAGDGDIAATEPKSKKRTRKA